MTHALIERAMVANLSIGIWQGYRLDKEASAKVTKDAGAKADAARVNKHLVPKEALAPVVTASGAIRTHFYEKTMPWRDNGDRILTKKLFLTFVPEHERLVGVFNDAVRKFLDVDYATAIEQASFRMGELFKPEDYPRVSDLHHRFYARLDIDAITTKDDFRVQIDGDHVDRIKASMEAAAEARFKAATADIWRRIGEAVGRAHERLAKPDAVFQASTIENVQDLIELLPGLNVLDDPNIEVVRQMIEKSFAGADAIEIRKDPAHREELAGEAQKIIDKMAGFMGMFGNGAE